MKWLFAISVMAILVGTGIVVATEYTWIDNRYQLRQFIENYDGTLEELATDLEYACHNVDTTREYGETVFRVTDYTMRVCTEYEEVTWISPWSGRTYTWTRCINYEYETDWNYARCRGTYTEHAGSFGFFSVKYKDDLSESVTRGNSKFDAYWSSFPVPVINSAESDTGYIEPNP